MSRLLLFLILIPSLCFPQLKRAFIAGGYNTPNPPSIPRNYYISSTGTGDGLTSGTPAPLSVLQSAQLIVGDHIYLKRGDTFYFTEFNIHNIGSDTLRAYGSGANPICLGSYSVGAQTFIDNGDGTWYISLATAPKWVTEGDVLLRLAESDWVPITVNVSAQVRRVLAATVNAYSSTIVGSVMHVKEFAFRLSTDLTVTGYDSGTGNITFTGSLVGGDVGMPLKFIGKQFMTTAGDWFYDAATQRLYIKSTTSPTGRDIRIITEDVGLHVQNQNGLLIRDIDFKHYFKYGILAINSQNVQIKKSTIKANRGNGIRAYGSTTTGFLVDSSELSNNGLRAIEFGTTPGASFTNLNIFDIGVQGNLGFPFDQNKTGGTAITPLVVIGSTLQAIPDNIVIDHNSMINLGYQGVQVFGKNWQMTHNLIHDYDLKWSDGGGVHLYYNTGFVGSGSTSGNLVQHNIIYNGVGNSDGITAGASALGAIAGVYHDSGINNNTIDNNVIFGIKDYTIFCNDHGTQHIITNNILHGPLWMRRNTSASSTFPFTETANCTLSGNIIALDLSTDRCVVLWNQSGGTWMPFTTIDNNHYVSPYNVQGNINATSTNGFSFSNYTLSTWRTFVSGDASSTSRFNYKTTPDSDDILIQTNATDNSVNFNTPAGYSDYNAGAFTNPVSIPAWYGLIYFQN